MSFPAYNRGNRNRDPQRGMNLGSSSRQRSQRMDLSNFGRTEPPAPLSLNGFGETRASEEQFHRTYHARQRETFERHVFEQARAVIQREQENSVHGIQHVTLDDGVDDDPDFVPMGTVQSAYNPPQEQQIQYIVVEKEKKSRKKKKHRRRSSSSSSSEEEEDREKKSKKKRKRRRHSSGSDTQDDENEGTSQKRARLPEPATDFHFSKNPWRLLRKSEYSYIPAHMVMEPRADRENLQYEQPPKSEIADYRGLFSQGIVSDKLRVISENLARLMNEPAEFLVRKEDRWFAEVHFKFWNKTPAERLFRKNPDREFKKFVSLSHQPCSRDDEGASRPSLDSELLQNFDINDYGHYQISNEVSYEEIEKTDIQAKYSVLHNAVNVDRFNVKAWLDFIDIQRPYHARNECGDENAPIQNEKAYYERVMEIIRRAAVANQASPEIQIKKIKVMEGYLGRTSDEVKKEWARCENCFINNLKMWEDNLKMRMNDRSIFALEKMLLSIIRCIGKLVRIKQGIIVSHAPMEGTEEFLVDLLVVYCSLLISTGFIDRAVAMFQALAEFHFFCPPGFENDGEMNNRQSRAKTKMDEMHSEFRRFWESGVLRIGDPQASGWCYTAPAAYDDCEGQLELNERDQIEALKLKARNAEDLEVEEAKRHSYSFIEARRRLDRSRAKYFWRPVRINHPTGKDLYEFDSRYVPFEQIKPILFPIENDDNARELMYKMLHIFGISIPGLKFKSQFDILRSFSRTLFPSFRPNALKLDDFQKFMNNFIEQLADSERMDPARIYPAIVTNISNSSLSKSEKGRQLKTIIRSWRNGTRHSGNPITTEIVLPVWMVAFEEIVSLKENPDDFFKVCVKLLHSNLDERGVSIWELGEESDDGEQPSETKIKEKLFFLRFLSFLAKNLPFSDDPNNQAAVKTIKTSDNTVLLRTKKELLLSIWATGKVSPIVRNETNEKTAKDNVKNALKKEAPRDLGDLPYRWIGNKYELIFELAALFCYEIPFFSEAQRYKFFQEEKPLFNSVLATSLGDSTAVQEVRVHVLKHIMHTCKGLECTPQNLIQLVEKQVHRFPHSIPLLKTLLDVNNSLYQRKFLSKYPGDDQQTRLIRDCGRLYVERAKFEAFLGENGEGWESKDLRTMFARLIGIYKQVAERNSDNLLPDDYIWFSLMKIMIDGKECISYERIDEVFTLGQKLCPWSKAFLFETARNRPSTESSFLTSLNHAIGTHGLNNYVLDAEVQVLISDDYV